MCHSYSMRFVFSISTTAEEWQLYWQFYKYKRTSKIKYDFIYPCDRVFSIFSSRSFSRVFLLLRASGGWSKGTMKLSLFSSVLLWGSASGKTLVENQRIQRKKNWSIRSLGSLPLLFGLAVSGFLFHWPQLLPGNPSSRHRPHSTSLAFPYLVISSLVVVVGKLGYARRLHPSRIDFPEPCLPFMSSLKLSLITSPEYVICFLPKLWLIRLSKASNEENGGKKY